MNIVLSGTYQFSRGVQTGGAAPSIQATWGTTPASATTLGRAYSAGATTKSINLMAVGANYGFVNLSQLDIRASKRFKLGRSIEMAGDVVLFDGELCTELTDGRGKVHKVARKQIDAVRYKIRSREFWGQGLVDDTIGPHLPSLVNDSHRTAAKFTDQFITGDVDRVLARL